mgnify:CR=1 FL=1
MPQELKLLSGKNSEWDGYVNLTIQDKDGKEHRFENIDVLKEMEEISKSLNPDENVGIPFMNAVRRYIAVRYGVEVSVWSASDYYEAISKQLEGGEDFFIQTPGSLDSTDSTQPGGADERSSATSASSIASEPKST